MVSPDSTGEALRSLKTIPLGIDDTRRLRFRTPGTRTGFHFRALPIALEEILKHDDYRLG